MLSLIFPKNKQNYVTYVMRVRALRMPCVEAKKGFIPSIIYQLLIACCRHCEELAPYGLSAVISSRSFRAHSTPLRINSAEESIQLMTSVLCPWRKPSLTGLSSVFSLLNYHGNWVFLHCYFFPDTSHGSRATIFIAFSLLLCASPARCGVSLLRDA
jgi:hypothetical protein